MKKLWIALLFFGACATNTQQVVDVQNYIWEDVEQLAQNTTVTMYMWGGSEILNNYMANYVAPALKEKNQVTLNIVPISDVKDAINKLIVEKQANRQTGSVDVLWLNGENFKILKDAQGMWGAFALRLPAMQFINSSTMNTDFGTPIENLEAPWGEAQFNFIYKGVGNVPFTDSVSLANYVRNNPGRFTYPAIPDFSGSAFVRNIAIDILGFDNIVNMSSEELENALNTVWTYFNDLKPFLWRNGENYPESSGKLDLLFQNDNVDIMMSYSISHVTTSIARGVYPETSKSFLLNKGTLFNNNYLTIPWNAPNKASALYLINYLLSKDTQITRLDPSVLGWSSVLDISKLDDNERVQIMRNAQGKGMVSLDESASKRISELTPEKLEIIEQGWLNKVAGINL